MFVVDRIEGNFAIVEFGEQFLEIPLSAFKERVKEGDVLYLKVDKTETNLCEEKVKEKMNRLFKHS